MKRISFMTGAELRSLFLKYFEERNHAVVASSPLIPLDDPTLLFTNAGMVQFKDVFLGREHKPYVRAATSQRCVRAGGKHNDLENVGYTARHHTFFEMLGNFSFGDYFKREAIQFAWGFLTGELKLPPEKLWVTVFDEDQEAEDIWLKEVGISPERFTRIGAKDNFWSMGDTGPCGPCSEIFYDHGEDVAGGPPGSPDESGDRYIEIWNLVFMQYDRSADGVLTPLPKPSVDTGMGLERLAAVMQGVHNNYEIDLFEGLVKAAAKLANIQDLKNSSLRVIADHIRSCSFLIVDGVMPSNEGRGYALRRIIRRAIRHGYKLGVREPFFHKLVAALSEQMGEAYPELPKAQSMVERVLLKEEERFSETLDQGMKILDQCIKSLRVAEIPGDVAFQLYDTYGFPVDLTADVAREHGLSVDMEGFERAMDAQRKRARAASHFVADYSQELDLGVQCEFTGYQNLTEQSKILAISKAGQSVASLEAGDEAYLILDKTPFYAESGGQVGDQGLIQTADALFEVKDTRKQSQGVIVHAGKLVRGKISKNDACEASVDSAKRNATSLNHSATHLLHAALRQVLGDHVAQKGSLVNPERLRFDFSHFEPMTLDQVARVERIVNDQIRLNQAVTAEVMAKEQAMQAGAMALFGEKYGDEVRVLKIGDFSTELCGGIHADRAGDIGFFKIVSETGVAAGVRRIEGVTGSASVEWVERTDGLLQTMAERLKSNRDGLDEKLQQLIDKNRSLEKELEKLKSKLSSSQGSDLASSAIEIKGLKLLVARLDEVDAKSLRELVDQLKNKLGSAAILLASVQQGKVSLIAGVTSDQTGRIKAGDLVNQVALKVGGKGGGRADLAQAGGSDPSQLQAALDALPEWVGQQLI